MTYTKPEFYVTEFEANEAVSECTDYANYKYESTQVSCLATGTDIIFNASVTTGNACVHNVTLGENGTDYMWYTDGNDWTNDNYLNTGKEGTPDSNHVHSDMGNPIGVTDHVSLTDGLYFLWKSNANSSQQPSDNQSNYIVELLIRAGLDPKPSGNSKWHGGLASDFLKTSYNHS